MVRHVTNIRLLNLGIDTRYPGLGRVCRRGSCADQDQSIICTRLELAHAYQKKIPLLIFEVSVSAHL